MYVAGTAPITLLWAAIASVGVGSQYAILTLATEFAERSLEKALSWQLRA